MITSIEALNPQELSQARAKVQVILELTRTDSHFRQKAIANPAAILSTFGFPARAVPLFGITANGVGNPICCSDGTCVSSNCPSTCYITCNGDTSETVPNPPIIG